MDALRNMTCLLLVCAWTPFIAGCPGGSTVDGEDGPSGSCPSDADTFQKMNGATYAVVLEFRIGPGANDIAYHTLGTAFAIDERLMATNAHITEFFNELCGVEITNVFGVQSGTGTVVHLLRALTHPDYTGDPLGTPDVGLLTSQEALPVTLDVGTTAQLADLALGDDLLMAGFPGDVQALFEIIPGVTVPQASSLSGTITALRAHSPTDVVTAENTDVVQHQVPTTRGTSGSALVRCGRVAAINNAGTGQVIVTVDAAGNVVLDTTPAADNNFGVHAKYITEMVDLFTAQALQGFELPPVDIPPCADDTTGDCGAGDDPACDYCWAGTCLDEWNGDGDCDCGCQFLDQDCGDVIVGQCGAGDDPACDWCWAGTEAENNCNPEWNGDGELCDCGCQFEDVDCAEEIITACGAGDDPGCEVCWGGTQYENNCNADWNGDGECDCDCQFEDVDCDDGQPTPNGCDCDLIYALALAAVAADDDCILALALFDSFNCNCCAVNQELCFNHSEELLLEMIEVGCADPEPPEDSCPSGCREGSVCCGFPFCAGNCIYSPCCN